MIRRPPRSTRVRSSAASDVYKRQHEEGEVNVVREPLCVFQAREGILQSFVTVLGVRVVSELEVPPIWVVAGPVLAPPRLRDLVASHRNDLAVIRGDRCANLTAQICRPECGSMGLKHGVLVGCRRDERITEKKAKVAEDPSFEFRLWLRRDIDIALGERLADVLPEAVVIVMLVALHDPLGRSREFVAALGTTS